jgi:hypothetical protein
VKVFFEDRNMERSTCAFFNEDANCENRGRRQVARAHSLKAHLGAHFGGVFFEDRNMERSTCAFFNEDANCENRGRRQLARAHSHKAHLGAHFSCSAEVIDITKRLYSSEAPLLVGIPLAPGGVVIEVRGRTIRSQALNGQSIEVFLLLSLSLSPALFSSLVMPKYSLPMCFVPSCIHLF